jgi:hypothetical protein
VGSMFWPWLTGQFFKSLGPQTMALVIALNLFGSLAITAILILRPPHPEKPSGSFQ